MKIAVAGLFHLGCVTAACLAESGHEVVAYDSSSEIISKLRQNQAPIFEPGLNELIAKNKIHFTYERQDLSQADLIWVTYDTPVDDQDIADVESVMQEVCAIFPYVKTNAIVLISSQLPVGTTRKLQEQCKQQFPNKNISFACSPENLRLGNAIRVFMHPDRIIVGVSSEHDKQRLHPILKSFTENIVWMSIESAEMTKHALNAFLATSVVFINELSSLCERVGANAREVEMGLKSEERIGKKAYLRPGHAIAGGTLARDVNYLVQIGKRHHFETHLFSALLDSNHAHKKWSCTKMTEIFRDLKNKTIALLGLTYKAGTDTLRRSTAVEMCEWLKQQGANIFAYDPAITALPPDLQEFIQLKNSIEDALHQADAVVLSTEWPEFSSISADKFLAANKEPIVVDPSGFLAGSLSQDARIKYFSVGR